MSDNKSLFKELLKIPITYDRNAHILNGLLKLDSKNRLDPHLFSHILEYQAYDTYLHTPEYAIASRNIELGKFLIENDLCDLRKYSGFHLDNELRKNDDDAIVYIASITNVDALLMSNIMHNKYYNSHTNCSSKLAEFILDNYKYNLRIQNLFNMGVILLRQKYLDLNMIRTYVSEGYVNWDEVLVESAWGGHIDIMRYSVEQEGAVINNNRAVSFAAHKGHLEVVKYLVERGADVNSAICEDLNIVRYCLDNGASATKVLAVAVCNERFDMIETAIEYGAEITHRIFDSACRKGNLKLVKFFVELGAAVRNCGFLSALCMMRFDIAEYLLEHGADVDMDGGKSLILMSRGGKLKTVKYLVERGANVINSPANVHAARKGHIDVVKYLVEHGADVNYGDNDALRATRDLEVAKYLVKKGADAKDSRCLEYAVSLRNLELMQYLLENGASITPRCITYAHDDRILNYLRRLE